MASFRTTLAHEELSVCEIGFDFLPAFAEVSPEKISKYY